MIRSFLPVCALVFGAALAATPVVAAQQCTQNEIASVISGMGTKLRQINAENQTRLQSRLRELAKLKGWSEAETEENGLDLLEDDETRVQDETASHLLTMVDKLGQTAAGAPPCEQIEELKAAAAQLVEVTGAKAAHISAKLDNELKAARTVATLPSTVPQEPAKKPTPPAGPAKAPPAPLPRPASRPAWETQTSSAVKPNDAYLPPPSSPVVASPVAIDRASLEFSPDDIRAAGSGLFGTMSAELAAVIEYLFKSYGRPTGYILGTEGGVALVAGLRYGEGTIVTKMMGERKIYWQGPSVGYDLGLTGSRAMILIYNLTDANEILQRFGGVDGSAYLVGGAGVTILKRGPIILAPIRTGLGLRLGANVGYLKFTPRPRFSPF